MTEERPSIGNYYLGKTIGLGSQAKVKLGENKITGAKVAVKIIKVSHFTSKPDLQKKLRREMSLMRVLDHPHLLKLVDVCETEKNLYLILEYAKNGELFEYLSERGFLSAQVAMNFFRQIIYGLEFLHKHSLCHRDLKPQNILLDEYNNVKIGDFGFARWMKTNVAETQCGSPLYAAPEVIRGGGYDGRTADIWGAGVIFYTLLCGRLPFEEDNVKVLLTKIRTADFKMPNFPDPIKDLISRMLCVDVGQRITIDQIKQHPAFRLLMPNDYVFPTPLPSPNIIESIDLDEVNPEIITVLQQLGFNDRNELRDDLMADHTTQAKSFIFLMLKLMSFDSLPWDENEPPIVFLNLTKKTPIDRFNPFQETANWRPYYQSSIPFYQMQTINDINQRYEVVVTAIQRYFTECGFKWFYPHDLLIMARQMNDMTDLVVRIEHREDEKLRLIICLASGDDLGFSALVSGISKILV